MGTNLNMAATQTPRFTRESEGAPAEAPARSASADPSVGPGPSPSIGLLLGRLLVGFVIAAHGYQKLFDIGPKAFGTAVLQPTGIPAVTFFAYVVTLTELVGGILLMLGLLTRLAALALTIDLVMAIVLVAHSSPLIAPTDKPGGAGLELNLVLIAGFLVALFAGPGRFSLDRAFGVDGRSARPFAARRT
jgi:putative oxidoreductase